MDSKSAHSKNLRVAFVICRDDTQLVLSPSGEIKVNASDFALRVIFEKSKNENQGNCWNSLIVPNTTAWLEMTGATVLKVSEIGQSAAELLNRIRRQEEGSETQAPDT